MDVHRLRTPDYVTGLFGLLLFCSLFAPWYEMSDGTADAWRSFGLIDLWFALTALLALAVPVITALRDAPALPVAFDVLTVAAALVSAVLVVVRLLSVPNAEFVTGRHWGVYAGLACVAGTLLSSWWALRTEDAPDIKPPPPVQAMPTPPAKDPYTPPT